MGRAVRTCPLGAAAWCFPQLGPGPVVLWSASGLTFTSRTCLWICLLPGVQVYKQKTNRANKNIISLMLESAAPDVLGGQGGDAAEPVGAQPGLRWRQGVWEVRTPPQIWVSAASGAAFTGLPPTCPSQLATVDTCHLLGIQLVPLNPHRHRAAAQFDKWSC